jgi:hypothetical protein
MKRREFLHASLAGAASIGVFTSGHPARWPRRWTIWLQQAASSAERIAAEHLCGVLQGRGADCQVMFGGTWPTTNPGGQICLGVIDKCASLRAFINKQGLQSFDTGEDGYLILSDKRGTNLAVGSATPRGVLYGTFALAERLTKANSRPAVRSIAKPALKWRWISTPARDMAFYRRLITEYAPSYKFNLIHLWSVFDEDPGSFKYYLAQPLWFRKYPKLYETRRNVPILHRAVQNLKELSALTAERDLSLFYLFPGLHYWNVPSTGLGLSSRDFLRSAHPDFFNSAGEPDFASRQIHQFISDQVDEFFELYPQLGGLLGHTGEMTNFSPTLMSGVPIQHQTIPIDEIVFRIIQTVYEACHRHGKMLIWEMHSSAGDTRNSDAIIKAVQTGHFPGMMLETESTYTEQEFSLTYPTIHYLPDMVKTAPSIFAQDCYGEGWDFNPLPFIVDQYLVRHFRDCEKAGATGGGVLHYVYQGKYHAFNTLQNINLELQTRMMWEGGSVDPEQVKLRWLEKHYGKAAAAGLLKAFNRVNLILSRVFYIAGNGSWGLRHGFPSFSAMQNAPFWFIEFFSPPGTLLTKDWTRRTAAVRATSMEQMRQEKQEPVDQAALALQDLARVKRRLRQEDYSGLLARFVALWYYARAGQSLLEIGYYFKNAFIEHYDMQATDSVRNLAEAGRRLRSLVSEARADSRLRGLEEDIYRLGLEKKFLQRAEKFSLELDADMKKRNAAYD